MAMIFLSAMAVAFSGAVMPGPLLTYTIKQSLLNGSKAGWIIILGHAILELLLIALIFFGFNIILQSSLTQIVIGLVGGVLLAWMGASMVLGAIQNSVKIEMDGGASSKSMVISGFVISAMNPYFIIWWAIIGLGFLLQAYKSFGVWGVLVYYIGHITTDFLWYGFVSAIIGKTRRFIHENLYRVIIAVLGCMLIYFGVAFIMNAIGNIR